MLSIGGDSSLEYVTTLPNLIKQYNPDLIGFSVNTTTAFDPSNIENPSTGFNLAISGARASNILDEAVEMVAKMKADQRVNFEEDWKVVTLLAGVNDLCQLPCIDSPMGYPDAWVGNIKEALDYMQEELPKTLVNLVQIYDNLLFSKVRVRPTIHMVQIAHFLIHYYVHVDCMVALP